MDTFLFGMILFAVVLFGSYGVYMIDVNKKHEKEMDKIWDDSWKDITERANRKANEFPVGAKVYAKNKNKEWKSAVVLNNQGWEFFMNYFMVKFDDGEINKVPYCDISNGKIY